jgi:transposase-like protein
LKLPESHRRTRCAGTRRTTNSLERLIEAARRRTKLIGTMPGETAGLSLTSDVRGLSLVYAVLVDVAKRWRGLKMESGDLEKLAALKAEVAPLALSA